MATRWGSRFHFADQERYKHLFSSHFLKFISNLMFHRIRKFYQLFNYKFLQFLLNSTISLILAKPNRGYGAMLSILYPKGAQYCIIQHMRHSVIGGCKVITELK